MSIVVTMQVSPVGWDQFKAALDWTKATPAQGRTYSRVYRAEGDPAKVLIVEEWDSHDSMHRYQDQVGEEFNRRAGTEGAQWDDQVWELSESI